MKKVELIMIPNVWCPSGMVLMLNGKKKMFGFNIPEK
jgi:hypothetical protein